MQTHLGDSSDHVGDETPECPEHSDVLPATLPDGESDAVGLALHQPDVDICVSQVLRERTAGASNGNEAGLDGDFNTLWDFEFFSLENVPHLESKPA